MNLPTPEPANPPEEIRLLSLGDSYTIGTGVRSEERFPTQLANLLQEPIYLASGLYFPVRALGFWVGTLASVVPLTLGIDAMRQLLFSGSPTLGMFSVPVEIAVLLALTALFLTIAYVALSRLEERGRREGRLIERRR